MSTQVSHGLGLLGIRRHIGVGNALVVIASSSPVSSLVTADALAAMLAACRARVCSVNLE